jgi:DNA primase
VAGRVPEHVIQQIARSVDFVRLAGRYTELKKKGKSYWGLCPFHKEKTPSFSVDPEDSLYFCFGCKEGGNVFTLLQKLEGLTFGEALGKLAAEAGVDISRYRAADGPSRSELGRLRELHELATSFYAKCLQKAKGSETARDYLAARQIGPQSIERWRLGFAPEGWDHFLKCACGRGFEPEELAGAGLAVERQGAPGHYDRFRNRLMFPIADAAGRTIGFGARRLLPEDEPKYLNSPETPLFHKGGCFFGLAQAREAIRTGRTAVVLEGYTDVIMAHQCGVPEALAVLGTALTEEHARTLRRLCDRVVLVFDADEAGQKSAIRSVEVLLNEDLEIRVADLPAEQDPCDYLLERGGDEFRRLIEESRGFFEFRLDAARNGHDTASVDGRMAAFREVAETALKVRDPARRDLIVRRLAHELGMRERSAWAYLDAHSGRRRQRGGKGAGASRKLSAEGSLPSELLGLLLAHPEFAEEAARQPVAEALPECPEKEVIARLFERHAEGGEWESDVFLNSLQDPALASVGSRALAEERGRESRIREATPRERLAGYLDYLARRALLADGAVLPGDDEGIRRYFRQLKEEDKKSAESA